MPDSPDNLFLRAVSSSVSHSAFLPGQPCPFPQKTAHSNLRYKSVQGPLFWRADLSARPTPVQNCTVVQVATVGDTCPRKAFLLHRISSSPQKDTTVSNMLQQYTKNGHEAADSEKACFPVLFEQQNRCHGQCRRALNGSAPSAGKPGTKSYHKTGINEPVFF